MAIRRYYPTLLALNKDPLYRSSSWTPQNEQLQGASLMVLGGPPNGMGEGNEYWELIPPAQTGVTPWYAPFLPSQPTSDDDVYGDAEYPYLNTTVLCPPSQTPCGFLNSPNYPCYTPASFDAYLRPVVNSQYADRLINNYPRVFQTSYSGQLLVCGDVDEENEPANAPGTVWVIKPRVASGGSQTNWESLIGPSGPIGSNPWHDSFYDTAVLLHDIDVAGDRKSDRILVFGGSRMVSGVWTENDSVWEFERGSGVSGPILSGVWRQKRAMCAEFQRVWPNAVVLPTGQIFVEGGSMTDTEHNGGETVEVLTPIIYDAGPTATNAGAIYSQPATTNAVPRLYHHVAVLLPDGRVFIAGGKRSLDVNGNPECPPDPRYSGEIFSPPYLSPNTFARPIVTTEPPNQVSFSAQFSMAVEVGESNTIDSVAVLRPAAVTHHCDTDQRYVELFFEVSYGTPVNGRRIASLDVTAHDTSLGPPGYYMLFAIESDGTMEEGHLVPSVAEFINVQ